VHLREETARGESPPVCCEESVFSSDGRGSNDFPVRRKVNFQKYEPGDHALLAANLPYLLPIGNMFSHVVYPFVFGALDQERMEGALLRHAGDRNKENPVHGATNEQAQALFVVVWQGCRGHC